MATRYLIKEEGLTERFIRMIFHAVAHQKEAALKKTMAADPAMIDYIRQLSEIKADIEAHLAKHTAEVANNPDWLKLAASLNIS
jgi:hypothetical protein